MTITMIRTARVIFVMPRMFLLGMFGTLFGLLINVLAEKPKIGQDFVRPKVRKTPGSEREDVRVVASARPNILGVRSVSWPSHNECWPAGDYLDLGRQASAVKKSLKGGKSGEFQATIEVFFKPS
jgi:hypothetical protein